MQPQIDKQQRELRRSKQGRIMVPPKDQMTQWKEKKQKEARDRTKREKAARKAREDLLLRSGPPANALVIANIPGSRHVGSNRIPVRKVDRPGYVYVSVSCK